MRVKLDYGIYINHSEVIEKIPGVIFDIAPGIDGFSVESGEEIVAHGKTSDEFLLFIESLNQYFASSS